MKLKSPARFQALQGRPLYRLMSFSCAMAFLIFGYDAGVLGGVQTTGPFLSALGNPKGSLIIPLIASSYTLGCLAMAIILTFSALGSWLGRRGSILVGDVFVIIGGALQASSWSVGQIIAARVICGFGIGLISATVPTYMSETTVKKTERGPQVAIQCIYLINGVALAYWLDFGFTRMKNQVSWRFPIALQSVFCLLSFVCMLLLPDTPRWYYIKGRKDEGDIVLARLFGLPVDDGEVQEQRQEIMESIELESAGGRIKWTDWFWDRSELQAARRVRTSFLILSAQQNMGINVLVYYSTVILANVGLSPFLQQLIAAVMNTIFAIGTWFTPFVIERWGRRAIMFWTAVACTIFMASFIALTGLKHQTVATEWAAIALVIIFIFFIGFGWMGCPWLYGPEIAPLKYRHLGGAAGALGEWSMTFVTVFGGGIALQRVGYQIWFWQLGACILACIFVWFWCPETAGLSLEEIDRVFIEDGKCWPRSVNKGMRRAIREEAKENPTDKDTSTYIEKV